MFLSDTQKTMIHLKCGWVLVKQTMGKKWGDKLSKVMAPV